MTGRLTKYMMIAYLAIAPFTVLVPPVEVYSVSFSIIRPIGYYLFAIGVFRALFYQHKRTVPQILLLVLTILFTLSVIGSLASRPFRALNETFPLTVFLGMLNILSYPRAGASRSAIIPGHQGWKVPVLSSIPLTRVISPWMFWHKTLAVVGIFAAFIGTLLNYRIIATPTYREEAERLFTLQRLSSILDTSVGLWVLLAALLLMESSQRKRHKLLATAALLAGPLIIIYGQFRSFTLIALAVVLVVATIPHVRHVRLIILILLCASAVGFLIIGTPRFLQSALLRYHTVLGVGTAEIGTEDTSLYTRTLENEMQKELIATAPLTGHGWGLFAEKSIKLRRRAGRLPLYGHNLYYSLPARVGLPLAALIIGSYFALAVYGLHLARSSREAPLRMLFLFGTIAIASYLMCAFLVDLSRMSRTFPALAIFIAPLINPITSRRSLGFPQRVASPRRQAQA